MMNRIALASTLALATAALTTGCDKGGALMTSISSKAHELEGKLTAFVGDKVQGLKARLDGGSATREPTGDGAPGLVIPDGAFDADRGWQVELPNVERFDDAGDAGDPGGAYEARGGDQGRGDEAFEAFE